MLHRRSFCFALGLIAALCVACGTRSDAAEFPSRPITLIVAFAPGGVADTAARLLAGGLQGRLGQPVVVENRPGAGGDVAAGVVARSAADGYTLLVTTTAFAINLTLNDSKQYSAEDFAAIAFPATSAEVLVTNSESGSRNLSDLLESGKKKPLTFGTAGVGTSPHIMAEFFFREVAKVPAVHVPFQGGAPAISALLGNQIDVISAILGGGVAAQINGGKVRGLAVTADKRAPIVPNVPTFAELGYKDMNFIDWVGVFAPRNTDQAVVRRLNEEIGKVMSDPEVISKLTDMGFTASSAGLSEARQEFASDVTRWATFIQTIGLKTR
jgi:tripartite-type tricarboxylate transporter receptor subunit TctC